MKALVAKGDGDRKESSASCACCGAAGSSPRRQTTTRPTPWPTRPSPSPASRVRRSSPGVPSGRGPGRGPITGTDRRDRLRPRPCDGRPVVDRGLPFLRRLPALGNARVGERQHGAHRLAWAAHDHDHGASRGDGGSGLHDDPRGHGRDAALHVVDRHRDTAGGAEPRVRYGGDLGPTTTGTSNFTVQV
jgi:hypothetical protein